MSYSDDRRGGQRRPPRSRREPLFPLEAEDIRESGPRRRPPQPLQDMVGDLDDALDFDGVAPPNPLTTSRRPTQPPADQAPPARSSRPTGPIEPPERAAPAQAPPRDPRIKPIARANPGAAGPDAPGAIRAPQRSADGGAQRQPAAPATPARPSGTTPPAGPRPRKGAAQPSTDHYIKRESDAIAETTASVQLSHRRYHDATADLYVAEQMAARSYHRPAGRGALTLADALKLIGVALVSMLIIVSLVSPEQARLLSGWGLELIGADPAPLQLAAQANPPGDYSLIAPPSVTPAQIDQILDAYRSPATGTGQIFYDLGLEYGIDPAFAVAFFIHESGAGTNPRWDGMKQFDASDPRRSTTTHNIGNISCAGYPSCLGRWRDYPNWEAGIRDWYRLIAVEYIEGRGHRTVADVIPVYAPSHENDVQGYVSVVEQLVDGWRNSNIR